MPEVGLVDHAEREAAVRATRSGREQHQRRQYAAKLRRGGAVSWPTFGDGLQLSTTDQRALAAMLRHGYVNFRQMQRWFYGDNIYKTSRRLSKMVEAGLVERSRHEPEWAGRMFWVTSQTTALLADDLRVPCAAPSPPKGSPLHRLAVNDVLLQYESRGVHVLAERELRAAEQGVRASAEEVVAGLGVTVTPVLDRTNHQRWLCLPVDVDATTHMPDGAVVTSTGLRALEVELSVKDRAASLRILRSYRDSSPFEQVYYFVTAEVRNALIGYRSPSGGWRPGLLQDLHMLPDQPLWELDQEVIQRCPVRVFDLQVVDDGISWQLDMRALPDSMWISKGSWKKLRAKWAEHPSAGGPDQKMPFLRWMQTVWPQVRIQEEQELAALYTPTVGTGKPY